jgi:hypothetical protein
VAEPYARRVFLQALPETPYPVRYSRGARRRAAQLQGFLGCLHAALPEGLRRAPPELLLLSAADWQALFRQPYGLPFLRVAGGLKLVVPADYPERLLHRFDDALLAAGALGCRPPGELRELLDLWGGLAWGLAASRSLGSPRRAPWLQAVTANLIYLLALQGAGYDGLQARFVAWSRLGLLGCGGAWPLEEYRADPQQRRFAPALYFQGRFAEQAAALALAHGWDGVRALLEPQATGDAALRERLTAWEPSFGPFFAGFGGGAGEGER